MTVSRLGSVIGRLIVWWPDRANATPGGELDRLDAADVLFRRFHGAVDFGGCLAAVVRGAVAGVVGEVVIQRFQQIERGLQSVAYFGDVHGSLHLSCQLAASSSSSWWRRNLSWIARNNWRADAIQICAVRRCRRFPVWWYVSSHWVCASSARRY